jgi:phosphate starvation-inducible PhoH-like protein
MPKQKSSSFHIEFLNSAQKLAYTAYEQHDVLFLLGPAGSGKSFLATAFAVQDVLAKRKRKICLTRPAVEAGGEQLGFLPGTFEDKINVYMTPLYDCFGKQLGHNEFQKEIIKKATQILPLAYMRGITIENAIAILDEAQNCTYSQLKLYLTRLGENAKMIITGDLTQTDLKDSGLASVVKKLEKVSGIGVVEFNEETIVRHPLVAKFVKIL